MKEFPDMFSTALAVRRNKRDAPPNLLLAEGLRQIEEIIHSGIGIKCIFIRERGMWPERFHAVSELIEKRNIMVQRLRKDKIERLSDTKSPSGIVALVEKPSWKMEELLTGKDLIILASINDPGNLGTIVRTAEAGGMAGIILVGECVNPFNPKTVRAAMGASFRVPVVKMNSLSRVKTFCKENGITLIGFDSLAESDLFEARIINNPPSPTGLLLGGEAHGLGADASRYCDALVKIPMAPGVESLNLAIAAGIVVFHMFRIRSGQTRSKI